MSLMQLLSVSPTFTGAKNPPNPYRIKQALPLPKFAAVGRPISLAPKNSRPVHQPEIPFLRPASPVSIAGAAPLAPSAAQATVSPNAAQKGTEGLAPALGAATDGVRDPMTGLPRVYQEPPPAGADPEPERSTARNSSLVLPSVALAKVSAPGLRPMKPGFFRRLFGRKPALATPVQTEFPLQIKVIRNDLQDSDLEIVKVPAPMPQPAGPQPAESSEPAFRSRWTHRIFAPRGSQTNSV